MMPGHGGAVTWTVMRDSSELRSSPRTRRDLNRKTLNVFSTPPFPNGGLNDDGRLAADLRRPTHHNHTQRNYRRSPATGTATRLCTSMRLLTYCSLQTTLYETGAPFTLSTLPTVASRISKRSRISSLPLQTFQITTTRSTCSFTL